MPLIMDDDGIDVDDLFGDPGTLDLSPAPPAKGLAQRLEELRSSGCSQRLAWSRAGNIAQITQNGLGVTLRHLMCKPDDGKWSLSEEQAIEAIPDLHKGQVLTHLCWGPTGSELAIVDVVGRVSVLSTSMALNNTLVLRPPNKGSEDDMNTPVGLFWLNFDRQFLSFRCAVRNENQWVYSGANRKCTGPFHPAHKLALVLVTRSGHLKLLYQLPDSRWNEVSADLKTLNSSDDVLTHAAVSSTIDNKLFIATHSASRRLCLYRVGIKWNPLPDSKQAPQQFPIPSFQISHTKIEDPPSAFLQGDNDPSMLEDSTRDPHYFHLTQLDIIQNNGEYQDEANPVVVGVFVSTLNSESTFPGRATSSVVLWELTQGPLELHSCFDELSNKKSSFAANPKYELRRLKTTFLDRFVISLQQIETAPIIAVMFDDGSISFYDQSSFQTVSIDSNNSSLLSSMPQAGFTFPMGASGLQAALSPNACAVIVLDADHELHLTYMEHSYDMNGEMLDEGRLSITISGLTLAFARCCGRHLMSDDLLIIVQQQLSRDTQNLFMSECFRALNISADFSTDQERALRNLIVLKCLSVHAALGFTSYNSLRSVPAQVSWVTMNFRSFSVLFIYLYHGPTSKSGEDYSKPAVMRTLHGLVKWAVETAKFIFDDMFELSEKFRSRPVERDALTQAVYNTNSSALLVIICSMPRGFLRYSCRVLRGLITQYRTYAGQLSGECLHLFTNINAMVEGSAVRIEHFEKLVLKVERVVAHTYEAAGFGGEDRSLTERDMLISGRIPDVLMPVVESLVVNIMPDLKGDVDRLALYFLDYSWLMMSDDAKALAYRRNRRIDVFKKVAIGKGGGGAGHGQVRRCTRCCEFSEDTAATRDYPQWLMTMMKNCVCGAMFSLEDNSANST